MNSGYMIRRTETRLRQIAERFSPPLRIDPNTMWVQTPAEPLPEWGALPRPAPAGMWRLIGYVLGVPRD